MPRFYFDIYDVGSSLDDEGTVCTDLAHARREAMMAAGGILQERHDAWNGEPWAMKVRDETNTVVATLSFSAR